LEDIDEQIQLHRSAKISAKVIDCIILRYSSYLFTFLQKHFLIDQLPNDVLEVVFGNFDLKHICTQLAPISRRWHRLAYSTKSLWHSIKFDIDEKRNKQNESFAVMLTKVCFMIYIIDYIHLIMFRCQTQFVIWISAVPIVYHIRKWKKSFHPLFPASHRSISRILSVCSYLNVDRYLINYCLGFDKAVMLELFIKRMPNVRSLNMGNPVRKY
jgi:hypothetical protein